MTNKHIFAFDLTEELYEKLRKMAFERRVPIAEIVRGAMLGRINVHAHGNSGNRLVITETLVEMLNRGVTPYSCQKGSVGASGDLAPMSQIALLLLGEGKAFYKGELLDGADSPLRAFGTDFLQGL